MAAKLEPLLTIADIDSMLKMETATKLSKENSSFLAHLA